MRSSQASDTQCKQQILGCYPERCSLLADTAKSTVSAAENRYKRTRNGGRRLMQTLGPWY